MVVAEKIRYTLITMKDLEAGYREIEHTADWKLLVWAPDLQTLLEQSARGMYALSQATLANVPRVDRVFEIPFRDRESLVVDFLSELLFYNEDEGLGFDTFQITLEEDVCKFYVSGAPLESLGKEIKAVTYHGIEVRESENGLEVSIVFDV